jgi:hypothetical protein
MLGERESADTRDTVNAAEPLQNPGGYERHGPPRAARAEDHGDELGIAERGHAFVKGTLAGAKRGPWGTDQGT